MYEYLARAQCSVCRRVLYFMSKLWHVSRNGHENNVILHVIIILFFFYNITYLDVVGIAGICWDRGELTVKFDPANC